MSEKAFGVDTQVMEKVKIKDIVNILNENNISIQQYCMNRKFWANKYFGNDYCC